MITLLTALLMTTTAKANDLNDALYTSDADRAAAVLAVQQLLTPERIQSENKTGEVVTLANQ